jgi:exosortase
MVVGLGLCSLYGPTLWDLMHGVWGNGQQGHGLFVLVVSLLLMCRAWPTLLGLPRDRSQARLAYLAILATAGFYALGRSQEIPFFEAGSMVFMVAGCTLLLRGWAGLHLHRFTLPFMLMLVPLPVELVDLLTTPLHNTLCSTTLDWLARLGQDARSDGATLWSGGHELLMARICPGLPTLISLGAGLLLYLHLVAARSLTQRLLLAGVGAGLILLACAARPVLAVWLVNHRVGLPAWLVQSLPTAVPYVMGLLLVLLADLSLRGLHRLLPIGRADAQRGQPQRSS